MTGSVIRGGRSLLLTIILLVALAAAIGAVLYLMAQPKAGGRFTEFYVLDLEGRADNYPSAVGLGQSVQVILGIVNREGQMLTYKTAITIDGVEAVEIGPIILNDEAKWEQVVAFTPSKTGLNQRVDFLLYKEEATEPYRTLHLWIEIR